MSKQKNNGVAVLEHPVSESQPLLRINFADLDAIEEIAPAENEATKTEAPSEPEGDTEEAVLKTVESFDKAFAGDPLAAKYREFGEAGRQYADPVDATQRYIALGIMLADLMVAEHNLAPSSYDRAKVMKKCENALRACGVPEYYVKPQEMVSVYWVVRLDLSKPAEAEGEPRTFYDVSELLPDWLGGNLSVGVLRVLEKCISRASKNDELDVWEYKAGYEDWSRDKIERLHEGQLSIRQVERLYDAKRKALADAKKREKYAGLTAAEVASVEAAEKNASLQSKLSDLATAALTLQKQAADELKKGPSELKEFLANRGIIPAEKAVTAVEFASQMSVGDAKALVQELMRLCEHGDVKNRERHYQTLISLCKHCHQVVKKSLSAQESAKTAKVA